MSKYKVIFMGTPDFAVPSLNALINNNNFEVCLVVTQNDKKIGRKQILTPPPIKTIALENNIKVLQPLKITEIEDELKAINPDFIVVVAYGKIIPQNILDIPKYGSFNVHGSLLPKYRGAAVIQAPILNGDKETGVTVMQMDAGLDTGPILLQEEILLKKDETVDSLFEKLSLLGSQILPTALIDFVNKKIELKEQNNDNASYVKMIKKEDGRINWSKPAVEIERMARALNPWPGIFTKNKNGKIIKLLTLSNEILSINKYKVGEVFLNNKKIVVQCGNGAIIVNKLQLEGKKPMDANVFLNGQKDFVGSILGDS